MCETQARSTWCTCSRSDDARRWFADFPTRCSVCRRVVRPAIHVCTQIISVTYVHNLQRTTPTAFSRFSCVLRRSCLPVLTCLGVHHHHHPPPPKQNRRFAHVATRGKRCCVFLPLYREATMEATYTKGLLCDFHAAFSVPP